MGAVLVLPYRASGDDAGDEYGGGRSQSAFPATA